MKKIIIISFLTVAILNLQIMTAVLIFRFVPLCITPVMLLSITEGNGLSKDRVSYDDISPNFFRAVIAAEDARFFEHNGFDTEAIIEAIQYNKKHTKKKRGASTITMQTAKNAFLWHGRNFLRKGIEAYMTVLIEALWGKKRILEVYANVIETGEGVYGVQQAAKKYFNKDASELSKRQAALIAAVLPNPKRWSPAKPTAYISRRAYTIQARMNSVPLNKITGNKE